MRETIEITHPNGYKGILCGSGTMKIINPEGEEVFHTGFRNINSRDELYEELGEFPEFLKAITEMNAEDDEDEAE